MAHDLVTRSAPAARPDRRRRAVDVEWVVIGAGPYGLACATHLRAAGAEASIFGTPLEFWATRTPEGMVLRSPYLGSDIGSPRHRFSLPTYESETSRLARPIPVERFVDYGRWYQKQALPDLDERSVTAVRRTESGFEVSVEGEETVRCRRVVVAGGVGSFSFVPAQFAGCDEDLVSHTMSHHRLDQFSGRRVTVVGGGQSALETAALLHETGAEVDVVMRTHETRWLTEASRKHTTPVVSRILYAKPDVGPAGLSHVVAHPDAFARMPDRWRQRLARRSVRPAGAGWLRPRLDDVRLRTGTEIVSARCSDGHVSLAFADGSRDRIDHLMLGTGYEVDLAKYAFLPADIVRAIACRAGYPLLSATFETSVPGLHIVGAPAAESFGPLMRFVAGSGFAARRVARAVSR